MFCLTSEVDASVEIENAEHVASRILAALSRPGPVAGFTVDDLAQEIRRVDGNHDLGAGALAEALMPFLSAPVAGEAVFADVEARAEAWSDRVEIQHMVDVNTSVFAKWASPELLSRFRQQMMSMIQQAFIEGFAATPTPQPAAARGGEVFWRVRNGESERGLFYDLDVARENAGDGDTIEALVPDPALSAKGGS